MTEQIPRGLSVEVSIPAGSVQYNSEDNRRVEGVFIPYPSLSLAEENGTLHVRGIKTELPHELVRQIAATYGPSVLPAPEDSKRHPILVGTSIIVAGAFGVSGWAYSWAQSMNTEGSSPSKSIAPVVSSSNKPSVPTISPTREGEPSEPPEPTPTDPLQCIRENLTPAQQVGQLLLLGANGDTTQKNNLKNVAEIFNEYRVGGIVLMSVSDDVYKETNDTLSTFIKSQTIPPTIATDQEGGSVQRIGYPKAGKKILSQEDVGSLSDEKLREYIDDVIKPMYEFMASKGITMQLGPVADVGISGEEVGPLPGRTFSKDSETVAKISALYIQAASEAGLQSTMKHFPGLGEAMRYDGKEGTTDGGPMFTPSWSEIKDWTLQPYEKQKENPMTHLMMGTHTVPGLTTNDVKVQAPAALSKAAVEVARETMGQNVYIVTDDLNKPAVKEYMKSKKVTAGIVSKAVLEALVAGVDSPMVTAPNAKGNTEEAWRTQLEGITKEATAHMQAEPEFAESIIKRVAGVLERKGVDPCAVVPN